MLRVASEDGVSEQREQPQTLGFWREEVLRRAGQALQGRVVGLWEATADSVVPIYVGQGRPLPSSAAAEINEALRRWKVPIPAGSRWLACRLDMGRWCIAPERSDIPLPPPGGIERRKKERMTLELAGLCLGLIEERSDLASGGSGGPA
jgi:hypothetical protein